MSSLRRSAPNISALGAPESLRDRLVAHLSAEIVSGRLADGQRLPTEQDLALRFGVSRTVVREAVATLRADGLIVTRQGQGAFVDSDRRRRPFRIDAKQVESVHNLLQVVELRAAVEVEAAGLAAERACATHVRLVGCSLERFRRATKADESGVEEDFAFHLAVADASCNPRFVQFLEFLGHLIIPRWTIQSSQRVQDRSSYISVLLLEHDAIFSGIRDRDVNRARDAMRLHLTNGRERMRREMAALRKED